MSTSGTTDEAALAAALREHESLLKGLALRLCRSPADAQDLVQDTYERALRGMGSLRPNTNLRAWLVTIEHNLFLDRCRKKRRDPELLAMQTSEGPSIVETVAAPPAIPEEQPAWASVTEDQLRHALGRLNVDFRRVYELHALEGRSYQEIAESLSIPKATVGTRLIRARRKLRDLLMPERAPAEVLE